MISITTHHKQFELRINFSFAGFGKVWQMMGKWLSFSQIRAIEKHKQETLRNAGFNYWRM